MPYEQLKFFAAAAFLCYALFGFVENYSTHYELYPVFSWSLFSEIPNGGEQYSLVFNSVGDTVYEPALPLEKAMPLFRSLNEYPTRYTYTIQKLGNALDDPSPTEVEKYRAEFESIFGEKAYSYTVVQFTYNPRDLYLHGTKENYREVATFTSDL